MRGDARHGQRRVGLSSTPVPDGGPTVEVLDREGTPVEAATVDVLVGGWRRAEPIGERLEPLDTYPDEIREALPPDITAAFCQVASSAVTDTQGVADVPPPAEWDIEGPINLEDRVLLQGKIGGRILPFVGLPASVDPLSIDQRDADGDLVPGNWPELVVIAHHEDAAGRTWTGTARVPLEVADEITVHLLQKVVLGPRPLDVELEDRFRRITGHSEATTITYGTLTVWHAVPGPDGSNLPDAHRLFAEVRGTYQQLPLANPTRRPSLTESARVRDLRSGDAPVRYPTVDALGPNAGERLGSGREKPSRIDEQLARASTFGGGGAVDSGVLAFDIREDGNFDALTDPEVGYTGFGRKRSQVHRPLAVRTGDAGLFAFASAVGAALDELCITRNGAPPAPLYPGLRGGFATWNPDTGASGGADTSASDSDSASDASGNDSILHEGKEVAVALGAPIGEKVAEIGADEISQLDAATNYTRGLVTEGLGALTFGVSFYNTMSGFKSTDFANPVNDIVNQGRQPFDPNARDRRKIEWSFDTERPAVVFRLPFEFADETEPVNVGVRGGWWVEFTGSNVPPLVDETTKAFGSQSFFDSVNVLVDIDPATTPTRGDGQ